VVTRDATGVSHVASAGTRRWEEAPVFYVIVFTVVGIALVGVVVWRAGRGRSAPDPAPHHHTGTGNASHTHSGSAERNERKRRRAQSKRDRRKRH
jgi:hypothetical protein